MTEPFGLPVLFEDGVSPADGEIHAVSAVCTHMGCLVGWNETDCTWDCHCHGSRFDMAGSVLYGPALTPLRSIKG